MNTVYRPAWGRGKRIDWPIVGWMIISHSLAILALFYTTPANVILCVALYYLTGCLGITLSFHRMLTHRSFKTYKWLERLLATCGLLALQGGVLQWCGHHRMHHAGSDKNGDLDLHDSRRGFLYSHFSWMLLVHDDDQMFRRFSRDLAADPYYAWVEDKRIQMGIQVLFGLLLLYFGGVGAMLWGIFARLVIVYHVTWLVNSASHMFGYTNFDSHDGSKNCWWVGILAFGEGWHNNHHAAENVAAAGYRWWEFDLTYNIIRVLEFFGLVWDVVRRDGDEGVAVRPEKVSGDNSSVVGV